MLSGIVIDLARAFGAQVWFVESSFARLIGDLVHDRCDIVMFAIGIILKRVLQLRFTRSYLANDIYTITTKSNHRSLTCNACFRLSRSGEIRLWIKAV